MECKCPMTDGIHDIYCPTNNEYEYYKCTKCSKGVVQYSMAFGMCQECQKNITFDGCEIVRLLTGKPKY